MLNLNRILTDFLDNERITNNRLRRFIEDFLQRLITTNPNNVWDPIIASISAAYTVFFGKINNKALNLQVQVAMTKIKDNTIDAFIVAVRELEGLVKAKFHGKESPEYLTFFSKGLTQYDNMNLDNAETLMTIVATLTTQKVAVLGQETADLFDLLKTTFINARHTQEGQMGIVSGFIITSNERKIMTSTGSSGLHFVAYKLNSDTEAIAAFYNQQLLIPDENSQQSASLTLQPMQMVTAMNDVTDADTFTFRLLTAGVVQVCRKATQDACDPTALKLSQVGVDVVKDALALGKGQYLQLMNTTPLPVTIKIFR